MNVYKLINKNYTNTNNIPPRFGKYIKCDELPKLDNGVVAEKLNSGKIEEILCELKLHDAVILYGPGGTGKTYAINSLIKYWDICGIKYQITATTGIATTNFPDAKTIHSWSGLRIRNTIEDPFKEINRAAQKAIKSANILVIDEISMLSAQLFETLEEVCRKLRGSDKFFGGIKLIMSGDFKQLPPPQGKHCWRAEKWKNKTWDIKIIKFEEPKRFDNIEYHDFLKRVRVKQCTRADLDKLKSRVIPVPQNIKPLIIMGYRSTVASYNSRKLDELKAEPHVFTAEDSYADKKKRTALRNKFNKRIPEVITLKVGARVMLRVNLDTTSGLCNGACGTVISCAPLMVDFGNDLVEIKKHKFKFDKSVRYQIPLILAWAITIHKSQGCTLDCVQCDLSSEIFTYEQIYVVLSRVRNFDSLYIKKINERLFVKKI